MKAPTFALGIPHAAHRPERRDALNRLMTGLEFEWPDLLLLGGAHFKWQDPKEAAIPSRFLATDEMEIKIFDRECPYWEWAEEMWMWQVKGQASHCLTLQDDVQPMLRFWSVLSAMVTAVPDKVLALETVHPIARKVARQGQHRFVRTLDGLVGVQYVVPHAIMQEFLEWQATRLIRDGLSFITEDVVFDLFLLDSGHRAWHPIPAIAEHDVTVPSTNEGHDFHDHRNVCVSWKDGDVCGWTLPELETVEFWTPQAEPPDLGLFYNQTPIQARMWVKGFTKEKYAAAVLGNVPPEYGQWQARKG